MFEGFTDRARHVVERAQDEAHVLNHERVDPEHILLGLISEGEGVAKRVLDSLGISADTVRDQILAMIGRGDRRQTEVIPFSGRAMAVFDLVRQEAAALDHQLIGTDHILLGLIGESEGAAARTLAEAGAGIDRVRRQVVVEVTKYG